MSERSMLGPDAEAALLEVEQVIGESMEAVLPTLLNQDVQVTVEGISTADIETLRETYPIPCVDITVECVEGTGWGGRFIFEPQLAAKIADLMTMGDGSVEELQEDHLDAIKETMDQVMGVVGRSLSSRFDGQVSFGPSAVRISMLVDEELSEPDLMAVDLQIKIGDLVERSVTQLVSQHLIVERLGHLEESAAVAPSPTQTEGKRLLDSEEVEAALKDMPEIAGDPSSPSVAGSKLSGSADRETGGPSIQPVQFAQFGAPESARGEPRNIYLLMDLSLPITVELGRVMMTIQDILELGQGAIVELDKLAGEPVDLLVNDKKFAEGEVVVVDENFGVRITSLASPRDRLGSLQ